MNKIQLNKTELKEVNKLYKKILQNRFINKSGFINNELELLLNDWIESLKNNLFFASISVFSTFLEKYLRDKLISYEYLKENKTINDFLPENLEIIQNIEEKIEDWKDQDQKIYIFEKICDKLVKNNQIENDVSEELKELYKDIRIPIQHWIYGRIIKKYIGRYDVWVKMTSLPKEFYSEWVIDMSDEYISLNKIAVYNPLFRFFLLPLLFKELSFTLLRKINQITQKNN